MNQHVPCLQPEAVTSVTPLGFKSRYTPGKGLLEIWAELHPSFHPGYRRVLKSREWKEGRQLLKSVTAAWGQRGAERTESSSKKRTRNFPWALKVGTKSQMRGRHRALRVRVWQSVEIPQSLGLEKTLQDLPIQAVPNLHLISKLPTFSLKGEVESPKQLQQLSY